MNDFEVVDYKSVDILMEDSCKKERISVVNYQPLPTFVFYMRMEPKTEYSVVTLKSEFITYSPQCDPF